MSYTYMFVSGRHRIIKTGPDGARFVTTATGPDEAAAIAAALTACTSDLAHHLVGALTELSGLGESMCTESAPQGFDPWYWERLEVSANRVDLTRRALSHLTSPDGSGALPPYTYGVSLEALARTLSGQPPSVVRAVREELSAALTPYDGVPVLAVVYDRKWDDIRTTVCLNAGLAACDDRQRAKVREPHSPDGLLTLIGDMEKAGFGDFRYAESTWEQGYLSIVVNRTLLKAWSSQSTA